jgi:hypothetical protein
VEHSIAASSNSGFIKAFSPASSFRR